MVIGSYRIGHHPVQVVLREGDGGEFYFEPELGKIARIKIGCDCEWLELISVIFHESMEFWLTDKGKRYVPSQDHSSAHDTYMFMFSHPDLSIMAHDIGCFLAESTTSIADAYKKWHKPTKKR